MRPLPSVACISIACTIAADIVAAPAGDDHPNIVVILADDMGYGNVKCNYSDGKIPTPHLDRLASHGMQFTDAHAPSSLCTPTRYALLTGRYAWRRGSRPGALAVRQAAHRGWAVDASGNVAATWLPDRRLRQMASGHGLAFSSAEAAEKVAETKRLGSCADIDWSQPIAGGPTSRGFDYYFGVNVPNFSPYAFIQNDRIVGPAPPRDVPHIGGRLNQHCRPRPGRLRPQAIAPTLAKKACAVARLLPPSPASRSSLLALTGPHSPIIPNDEFKGKSGIGDYGDWVWKWTGPSAK